MINSQTHKLCFSVVKILLGGRGASSTKFTVSVIYFCRLHIPIPAGPVGEEEVLHFTGTNNTVHIQMFKCMFRPLTILHPVKQRRNLRVEQKIPELTNSSSSRG